ncbi:recombinase family protein [Roseomonas chloroacetimidivorans]|uniref:recombinase family protein n=1 Tax=Roseomonas chloroacetimidivorans TaxID=1766656 RepID=UPI003C7768B0
MSIIPLCYVSAKRRRIPAPQPQPQTRFTYRRTSPYARVSSRRQAQAQTIEQQLDRLRAHAATCGWALAPENVFRDDGYSGASLRRPGLDRLRDVAASARLDRILITAPDRLARNYVHQVLLVEELQGHGTTVEFLDRPMSQHPHDQLLLQIRGAVAEYERTLITERMRRGRLRKLRAGVLLPWTRSPYGYRVDPERPRDPAGVRVDEAEAAVVRDLFAWFADEGTSVSELARRLHGLGTASRWDRGSWCLSAVRNVLTNPVYRSQVFANRLRARPIQRRRSALRPAGRTGDGRRVTDPAEWIAVATVPAIVGREQFERAQARLAYNQRMAPRNNSVHQYLLRGLVSCGRCRCRCACAGRHVARGYDYYVCRTVTPPTSASPGERCPTRHIPGGPLEELVWRDLCEVLAAPEMIAHAMERARGGHWLPQEMQARRANLRRARAGLHQQIERLTEAYLAGVVPLEEYERRRRETEGRVQALGGQERDLVKEADRQGETARLAAHAEEFCRRVRAGLEGADFGRKRELLELLVDRVVVTGEVVEIRYAIPMAPEGEREPFCQLRTDYQAGIPGPWR